MTTIVVWNVAKKSQNKIHRLPSLGADVAVVPECARDDEMIENGTMVWVGNPESQSCGLAVISYNGHTVRLAEDPDPRAVWTAAVKIAGPNSFRLLAVWADTSRTRCQEREDSIDPIGPLRLALRHHERFLRRGPTLVAGDFNHNTVWDKPLRSWNHSYGVADLASLGLVSAYHSARGCDHGDEPEPTFYTSKQRTKPHHLDFCFVPSTAVIESVEVGRWEEWCQAGMADGSDHAPLSAKVEFA